MYVLYYDKISSCLKIWIYEWNLYIQGLPLERHVWSFQWQLSRVMKKLITLNETSTLMDGLYDIISQIFTYYMAIGLPIKLCALYLHSDRVDGKGSYILVQ